MSNINEEIRKLKYDENAILARREMDIQSYKPVETKFDNDNFIVIKRRENTMHSDSHDIGIVDSIVDRTFPGSLLRINNKLVDNNPDILVTGRKPMKFRVNIPGMGAGAEFTVSDPTLINVSTAKDEVLKKYAGQSLPTLMTFKSSMAYSESQLNTTFGLEMKQVSKQLSIDFKSVFEKKSTVYVLSFRQIFYSVSADLPKNPSDVFSDSLSWKDLTDRGVDSKNPPGLVNKVGYGRSIYVKIETNEQSTDVEAALKAAINKDLTITANEI